MPLIRKSESLLSYTVYDNPGAVKGITIGFYIRHPDTGSPMLGHPDATEEQLQQMIDVLLADQDERRYVLRNLMMCKRAIEARRQALDAKKND
jgi:hypothetical protein